MLEFNVKKIYKKNCRDGKVRAYAANGRGLVGGKFRLDYPGVGATETLMMAASLADGLTVLSNAAKVNSLLILAIGTFP